MRLQDLFTEPGPDFADRLKFFRVTVIACEEECAVYVGPFPFAVVSTDDNEIQRVADAGQIVFLQLLRCRSDEPSL